MKDEKGGPMKELDFDELHEAVNKLMDQAQKPKSKREPVKSVAKAVSRPSVKVAERSAEKDAKDTKEKLAEPQDAGSAINVTVRKPAKIAPKKRGMAMDVVQAAKPTAVAPPSARAARTAPTLQPTGPVKVEAPSPRAASNVTPAAEPPKPGEKPVDVSEDTLASLNMQTDGAARPKTIVEEHKPEFPDPLEVHGFTGDEKAAAPPEPEPKPEPPASPLSGPTMAHSTGIIAPPEASKDDDPLLKEDDEPAKNQWEMPGEPEATDGTQPVVKTEPASPAAPSAEPASTPFVNAKVEKRPLGAFANATPAAAPTPAPEEPKPAAPDDRPEAASVAVPAAPEELNPEVVAVESADVDYSQAQDAEHDAPLNNLRQMAIPQQYHAGDKTPSKHDRPIFDTKDYHPPIQPVATAKHHSGSKAGTILTLILIILLVAAGVGAYFVATGSIDITRLF